MRVGAPEDWVVKVSDPVTKQETYVVLKGLYGGPLAAEEVAVSYVMDDTDASLASAMERYEAEALANGVTIADLTVEE